LALATKHGQSTDRLTLGINHLADPDDVVVVKLAQVLDLSQCSDREALVLHFFHQHVQLLQCVEGDFFGHRIPVLGFVYLAERAFTDLLDVVKV